MSSRQPRRSPALLFYSLFSLLVAGAAVPSAHAGPSCCAGRPCVTASAASTAAPGSASEASGAWLGILAQEITPELRESMSLPAKGGVLVGQVVDSSPAAEAGIAEGDVILQLDGKPIDDPKTLRERVSAGRPGDEVKVRLWHEGKEQSLNVKLGTRPSTDRAQLRSGPGMPGMPGMSAMPRMSHRSRMHAMPGTPGMPGMPEMQDMQDMSLMMQHDGPMLGVRVEALSEDLAGYFGVSKGGGVLVLEVFPDSPAMEAGLKAGDVIQKVGDGKIASPAELVKAIHVSKDDAVKLTVRRKGKDLALSAKARMGVDDGREEVRIVKRMGGPGCGPGCGGPGCCPPGSGMMRMGPGGPSFQPDQRDIDELREELRDLREELRGMKDKG